MDSHSSIILRGFDGVNNPNVHQWMRDIQKMVYLHKGMLGYKKRMKYCYMLHYR